MAKTSARRPRDISYNKYANNWDKTFGAPEELVKKRFASKKKKEEEENDEQDDDLTSEGDRTRAERTE